MSPTSSATWLKPMARGFGELTIPPSYCRSKDIWCDRLIPQPCAMAMSRTKGGTTGRPVPQRTLRRRGKWRVQMRNQRRRRVGTGPYGQSRRRSNRLRDSSNAGQVFAASRGERLMLDLLALDQLGIVLGFGILVTEPFDGDGL